MENALPAMLIGGLLVLAAALLSNATNSSVVTVGDSWRDMEALTEERLGTEVGIISTNLDGSGQVLQVVLRNQGRTTISAFERMDLIANYDGASGRLNLWLPYTETAPQPGDTWTVSGIANDNKNPGLLDTGEDASITVQLAVAVTGPTNRWLSFATESGVAYTVPF